VLETNSFQAHQQNPTEPLSAPQTSVRREWAQPRCRRPGPLAPHAATYSARYRAVEHALVYDFVAERLRSTSRWPVDERARQRRLLAWYAEAILIEGDRSGAVSRQAIRQVSAVLRDAGLIEREIDITERDFRTLCEPLILLSGEADPTGSRLYATLIEMLHRIVAGTADIHDLPEVTCLLLLFMAAWPTAVTDLASLRWVDIDPHHRVARVERRDTPTGEATTAFVPLTTVMLGALGLLYRSGQGGGYVFASLADADAPVAAARVIGRALAKRQLTPDRLAAIASRLRREYTPGYAVAAIVEGSEPCRVIADGDCSPLQQFIETRCANDVPATTARLRRQPKGERGRTRVMADAERWVSEARAVLRTHEATGRTKRGAVVSQKLRDIATQAAIALGWRGESLLSDLPDLVETADPNQVQVVNIIYGILLIAHRAERPIMPLDARRQQRYQSEEWWRQTSSGEEGQRPRGESLRAYLADIVIFVRWMGAVPMTDWSDAEWEFFAEKPSAPNTQR